MWRKHLERAQAQGRSWAEAKADVLEGGIPALDWPDVWRREWDGPVDVCGVEEHEHRKLLVEEAHHAAVERWAAIVEERREIEDVEDEERDEEAEAVHLFRAVQRDLPQGLIVGHDGPRVFLQDKQTGEEMTITSLRQAWKVIDRWRELSH